MNEIIYLEQKLSREYETIKSFVDTNKIPYVYFSKMDTYFVVFHEYLGNQLWRNLKSLYFVKASENPEFIVFNNKNIGIIFVKEKFWE